MSLYFFKHRDNFTFTSSVYLGLTSELFHTIFQPNFLRLLFPSCAMIYGQISRCNQREYHKLWSFSYIETSETNSFAINLVKILTLHGVTTQETVLSHHRCKSLTSRTTSIDFHCFKTVTDDLKSSWCRHICNFYHTHAIKHYLILNNCAFLYKLSLYRIPHAYLH